MKILIVDDYKTMRRIIKNLLGQIGYAEVDEAEDGSDWNMEPMTGYDLLKHVRADSRLQGIPFIMVTAESKMQNIVKAKQAGVDNYIVKPFNAATLASKIKSVIGGAA
jgi:two-component system chemotaxis response regulator CheY